VFSVRISNNRGAEEDADIEPPQSASREGREWGVRQVIEWRR